MTLEVDRVDTECQFVKTPNVWIIYYTCWPDKRLTLFFPTKFREFFVDLKILLHICILYISWKGRCYIKWIWPLVLGMYRILKKSIHLNKNISFKNVFQSKISLGLQETRKYCSINQSYYYFCRYIKNVPVSFIPCMLTL